MDKASHHYKAKKVLKYFKENKDTLIPIFISIASPEFMVMEQIGNIAKRDLFILNIIHHLQIFRRRYLDILEQNDSILI
jgi:hypothetical protein